VGEGKDKEVAQDVDEDEDEGTVRVLIEIHKSSASEPGACHARNEKEPKLEVDFPATFLHLQYNMLIRGADAPRQRSGLER
jgi:hypothetical protein